MVRSTVNYLGGLHCTAEHGPSGAVFETDAPKDNNGRGESFSPTDLVAAALGTCMLTIMGIHAQRLGVDLGNAAASIDKAMVADPERRIGELAVRIQVPTSVAESDRSALEAAAHKCPVAKSLHPDINILVVFEWG